MSRFRGVVGKSAVLFELGTRSRTITLILCLMVMASDVISHVDVFDAAMDTTCPLGIENGILAVVEDYHGS